MNNCIIDVNCIIIGDCVSNAKVPHQRRKTGLGYTLHTSNVSERNTTTNYMAQPKQPPSMAHINTLAAPSTPPPSPPKQGQKRHLYIFHEAKSPRLALIMPPAVSRCFFSTPGTRNKLPRQNIQNPRGRYFGQNSKVYPLPKFSIKNNFCLRFRLLCDESKGLV